MTVTLLLSLTTYSIAQTKDCIPHGEEVLQGITILQDLIADKKIILDDELNGIESAIILKTLIQNPDIIAALKELTASAAEVRKSILVVKNELGLPKIRMHRSGAIIIQYSATDSQIRKFVGLKVPC